MVAHAQKIACIKKGKLFSEFSTVDWSAPKGKIKVEFISRALSVKVFRSKRKQMYVMLYYSKNQALWKLHIYTSHAIIIISKNLVLHAKPTAKHLVLCIFKHVIFIVLFFIPILFYVKHLYFIKFYINVPITFWSD